MRHALDAQDVTQLLPLGQPRDGAAVVELEELTQRQDGEQLRLGELLGAGRENGVITDFPSPGVSWAGPPGESCSPGAFALRCP